MTTNRIHKQKVAANHIDLGCEET